MNENKVIVLGIDGMDPKFTKKLLIEGKLPNVEKMLAVGAAREDLFMLGGQPTITPPMWTTLSTGAYPMTHGITCYWNTDGDNIGKFRRNFNSAQVKAEQIWQVTAEAGKKTLVWTWPCSWPPVADDPNLDIVGGMGPMGPNNSDGHVDEEHLTYADEVYTEVSNLAQIELKGGAGCIVTDDMKGNTTSDADDDDDEPDDFLSTIFSAEVVTAWTCFDHMEGEEAGEFENAITRYTSPIREAKNWGHEVAAEAKEFQIIAANGLVQYPTLLLQNAKGQYDHIEVYLSKKDQKPLVTIKEGEFYPIVETTLPKGEAKVKTARYFTIVKMDPAGKSIAVAVGPALDIESDDKTNLWHPKALYQQVVDIAGYEPCTISIGGNYPELVSRRILPVWEAFQKWQAKALLGLIEQNGYEAIFTHNHSCDHVGHACWRWAKSREKYGYNDETIYQGFLEEIYRQTVDYIGQFLPLLDKGWAIIVTSDHGLLCSEEDDLPFLGEGFMMNVGVMRQLGYTVMKKDENGNDTHKIDWSKTTAVAPRGNHIYLNLKGRNPKGIVDPADQYELERKIIDDLYNYRMNGKRIVNIALRNKDAVLLGMSGKECGDILYWLEEGFNRLHGDSLSTTEGYFETSVSPIFFAAGAGLKKGHYTERMIREVDVAPTVAAIMDLRMPHECEGAPVYQILESQVHF